MTQVAAGAEHSLVVTAGGQLYAFGDNHFGELGGATNVGTDTPNPTPTPVALGPGTSIDAVAQGPDALHTLALVGDLTLDGDTLPAAQVGAPYRAALQATGGVGDLRFAAAGLPAGLTLEPATGVIAGTPSAPGAFSVAVSVSDADGARTARTLALAVAPARRRRPGRERPGARGPPWRAGPRRRAWAPWASRRRAGASARGSRAWAPGPRPRLRCAACRWAPPSASAWTGRPGCACASRASSPGDGRGGAAWPPGRRGALHPGAGGGHAQPRRARRAQPPALRRAPGGPGRAATGPLPAERRGRRRRRASSPARTLTFTVAPAAR